MKILRNKCGRPKPKLKVEKIWFRPQILPKNELTNSFLVLMGKKANSFVHFLEELSAWKHMYSCYLWVNTIFSKCNFYNEFLVCNSYLRKFDKTIKTVKIFQPHFIIIENAFYHDCSSSCRHSNRQMHQQILKISTPSSYTNDLDLIQTLWSLKVGTYTKYSLTVCW